MAAAVRGEDGPMPRRPSALAVTAAAVLDVVLVALFAAAGRASHDSQILAGLWWTSWPFLAGLAVGWVLTRAWRAPSAPLRTGVGVWAATLVGGMLLRAASGQGVVVPFVIVAGIVLLVFLVGWRSLAAGIRTLRRRQRRTTEREVSP